MPDNKPRKAYRTETPNLVDDWGLDPYAFRLLFHYRRWCGEHGTYDKTVRATAKLIMMSPAQVCRARQALLDQELISINLDGSVSVTDIWDLNRTWFVSGRNKSVSDRNKSVSDRNKLFLPETSPYRKNLLERNLLEDTTTTEAEGGGGGGSHPVPNSDAPQNPQSTYTLEQVTLWAAQEPGITMPDRFARARWLDGLADRRIGDWLARRESSEVATTTVEVEPVTEEMASELIEMLTTSLLDGRTIDDLERQFSAGMSPALWGEVSTSALEEAQRRSAVLLTDAREQDASGESL